MPSLYTITEAPTLEGDTGTVGYGINAFGQVAGGTEKDGYVSQAFLWTSSAVPPIRGLGSFGATGVTKSHA